MSNAGYISLTPTIYDASRIDVVVVLMVVLVVVVAIMLVVRPDMGRGKRAITVGIWVILGSHIHPYNLYL